MRRLSCTAALLSEPSLKGRFALDVLTVHDDGEQAVEQRLEALVSAGDDFVKDLNTQCN